MIRVTGALKIWTSPEGSSHFMSVPEEFSGEIRAHSMLFRRGFGSVRVEATIGAVTWKTSIFPSKSSGGYFLPVKIEVCRKEGLIAGDEVTVALELL